MTANITNYSQTVTLPAGRYDITMTMYGGYPTKGDIFLANSNTTLPYEPVPLLNVTSSGTRSTIILNGELTTSGGIYQMVLLNPDYGAVYYESFTIIAISP